MGKLNRLFIVIISCIVIGCASIPKANEKNQTLIVGQIALEAKNWPIPYAYVNGTYKTGIEITIENIESGKKYSVKSQNNGLFYLNNIPNGNYRISRLHLNKPSWKVQRGLRWDPRRQFKVIEGYVNNFGQLNWYCTRNNTTFYYNKEYEEVRNIFQEKYKSTNWNEKDWLDTLITRY